MCQDGVDFFFKESIPTLRFATFLANPAPWTCVRHGSEVGSLTLGGSRLAAREGKKHHEVHLARTCAPLSSPKP